MHKREIKETKGYLGTWRIKEPLKKGSIPLVFLIILLSLTLQITNHYRQSANQGQLLDSLNTVYKINKPTKENPQFEEGVQPPTLDIDLQQYIDRNTDTVGFLTIPLIELGLPIVQTNNNDYYLTHDFDKKENPLGWVFLDTRSYNKTKETNKVFYGHNVTTNNMFGNLKDFLNLKTVNENEGYLYYNTSKGAYVYEIVSGYVTHYENWAYTQHNFEGKEKIEFMQMIKEANTIEAFKDKEIKASDKLITLSTCYGVIGTTKRMVIHARLVGEEYK